MSDETVTLTITLPRNTVERLHGTTVEHWTDGAGSLKVDGFDTINVQFSEYGDEAAMHVGDVADLYLTAVLTVLDRTIKAIDPYMDEQIANDLNQLRTELEGNR